MSPVKEGDPSPSEMGVDEQHVELSESAKHTAMQESLRYFEHQAQAAEDYLAENMSILQQYIVPDPTPLTESIFEQGSEALSPGTKEAILRSLNEARQSYTLYHAPVDFGNVKLGVARILDPNIDLLKARSEFNNEKGYYFDTPQGQADLKRIILASSGPENLDDPSNH